MTSRIRNRVHMGIAISLIVALLLAVPVGGARAAGNSNPGILPPNSHAFGKTYGGWSAAWLQWALSIPTSDNPLLDTTGVDCGVRQSGPVFFLAGNVGGTATRDQCSVPAGKALFFPLLNTFQAHVACVSTGTPPGCDSYDTPQEVWDNLCTCANFGATNLYARIDGVPVSNLNPANTPYRVCAGPVAACSAPAFSLTLPADNLFSPLPAGTYGPAVDVGFYLLLAPLTPGKHTIQFGGVGSSGFSLDITYDLTVAS